MLALAHYLANRHRADIRPLPEFDPAFYLRTYPDVAASGLDPLEHYMIQGFREVRRPFEGFDPVFYRTRYLRHAPDTNPLLHFIEHRTRPGVHPALPEEETTIPREVRRRTLPGPFFEERRPLPDSAIRRARVLAYYLPQFHANPENDRWWGKGFTEWTNVARGMPRFADHYQPRVPRDLGHYTLDDPDILARQAQMAHEAGIEGFVFYFYWFKHRILFSINRLQIGFRRFPNVGFQFQNCVLGHAFLIDRTRIVLDHLERLVAGDRRDLVCRAASLGQ